MKKIVFALLLILSIFVSAGTPLGVPALCLASVETEKISADSIRETAYGIIEWKKTDVGAEKDGFLFNDEFLEQAGTTPGDWFPIGLGRLGVEDNQAGYLAVLSDNVQKGMTARTSWTGRKLPNGTEFLSPCLLREAIRALSERTATATAEAI